LATALTQYKTVGAKQRRARVPIPVSARSRVGKSSTAIPSGSQMSAVSKNVDEQEK
jgi:hypothetical protein